MLLKLSIASIRKMMKDYLVLLMGLVISISIFYMFQTMALNRSFTEEHSVISSIQLVYHVGSVLLAFITVFYIVYANSFLLSLRRKELGMYIMLGAKKSKISRLLFIETLAVGILSLVFGSMVGVLMASGVGTFLMNQLDIAAEGYRSFYPPALLMTCGFFLVLFIITALINAIRLSRSTELHLIQAEQHADPNMRTGRKTAFLVVLGIVCLTIGYYALIHMEQLGQFGFLVATPTTTIGTYLLFVSLLPLFVNALKRNHGLNHKKLNAFTFAQLRFRVQQLSKVLGTVAMLIALGVGAMAGGMAFQKNASLFAELGRVYDLTLHDPSEADEQAIQQMKIEEKLQYRYKTDGRTIYYLKEDLVAHPPLSFPKRTDRASFDLGPERIAEPLPAARYGVGETLADGTQPLPQEWKDVLFAEFALTYGNDRDQVIYLIDQAAYAQLPASEHTLLLVMVDDFLKYKPAFQEIHQRQLDQLSKQYGNSEVYIATKYGMYDSMYRFTSGTMFMGFFLGVAFLAMMASCLMFKILSGASRDTSRYSMLRKIGVRQAQLVGSIYKELFVVFLFPALMGILHVLVGMKMFSFILIQPYANIWLPIALFVLIYALYYLVTVRLYRGIVLQKET